MELSSYERRVLEEIEADLRNEDPDLDRLLSSMCDIDGPAGRIGGHALVRVWKDAFGSLGKACLSSLKRVPRTVYACAALGFIGMLVLLASIGGSGSTRPQACEQVASSTTTQASSLVAGSSLRQAANRMPTGSADSVSPTTAMRTGSKGCGP